MGKASQSAGRFTVFLQYMPDKIDGFTRDTWCDTMRHSIRGHGLRASLLPTPDTYNGTRH